MSVSRLSSVTVLNLSHNAIIALPETMSCLLSLKMADFSSNNLTVLPCGLGMASELETIYVRNNPLLAPPIEMFRREASAVVKYLRGVLVARKTGRLDWNGLGLMSIDSLVVMLPDGDASLVEELYLDDNLMVVLHPNVLYELQNLQVC
jgi:Leucine-rich repeat (LRR) protein